MTLEEHDARTAERSAIIAWLRWAPTVGVRMRDAAACIERGEHLASRFIASPLASDPKGGT